MPIVGVGVHLVTKVPVFAVTAAVLVMLLPTLVSAGPLAQEQLEELRALEASIRGAARAYALGIDLGRRCSFVPARGTWTWSGAAAAPVGGDRRGRPDAGRGCARSPRDPRQRLRLRLHKLIGLGRSVDGLFQDALESLAAAVTERVAARQEIDGDRAGHGHRAARRHLRLVHDGRFRWSSGGS